MQSTWAFGGSGERGTATETDIDMNAAVNTDTATEETKS